MLSIPRQQRQPKAQQADQQQASHYFKRYVGTVKAAPRSKQRLSLGTYSHANPAKGFSIEFNTRAKEDDGVTAYIDSSGSNKRYELTLCLDNNSNKVVKAEIWQI